jgi:hypothetical protein
MFGVLVDRANGVMTIWSWALADRRITIHWWLCVALEIPSIPVLIERNKNVN